MKIVRFQLANGCTGFGALRDDGSAAVIAGDIFGKHSVTSEIVRGFKLLAPAASGNKEPLIHTNLH